MGKLTLHTIAVALPELTGTNDNNLWLRLLMSYGLQPLHILGSSSIQSDVYLIPAMLTLSLENLPQCPLPKG